MRLIIISDTHGYHPWVDMPEGEVLIHCGDWCQDFGSVGEMESFADWMEAQPYAHKIVIAGNHDFPAQSDNAGATAIFEQRGIHYLKDSGVEINGVAFWGSPWQPEFCGMAFNLPRGERIWAKWSLIPENTDVLITHGPPQGILDNAVWPGDLFSPDNPVGCEELLRRVRQVNPRLHCFGHVHVQNGINIEEHTTFINAAICKGHTPQGAHLSAETAEQVGLRKPTVFYFERVSP